MDYFVGKSGDINTKEGKEFYLFNEEKIATFKLYNFDLLELLHRDMYNLLPDKPTLNYENCLLALGLEVNEKYRNKNYGKILSNLVFEECIKLNVEYFLGYRDVNNAVSKIFWDKLDVKEIINDGKISIILKKL